MQGIDELNHLMLFECDIKIAHLNAPDPGFGLLPYSLEGGIHVRQLCAVRDVSRATPAQLPAITVFR